MKRLITLALALCLLAFGAALAEDPISIDVTPLDYRTGKAIAKPDYNPDQLFKLRVAIDIPRFVDRTDLRLEWLVDGIEIKDPAKDANGYYIVEGVILDQPAALTVRVKDCAFDNADTAEDMYYALQHDRTVERTYYFYRAASGNITLPKTGDLSAIGPAAALIACAGLCWRKRR